MTSSTDWIREGAQVAEYNSRGYDPTVTLTTIEKLTKTQIVLANGRRYNREKLCGLGDSYRRTLLPVDHEDVRRVADRARFQSLDSQVDQIMRDVRNQRRDIYDALDAIEQAVREARTAIDHTTPRDRLARHLYATDLGAALRRSGEEEWDSGTAKPDDVQDCYTRADVLLAAMTGKEA